MSDAIGPGLARVTRDALGEIGRQKVSDCDAKQVILAMRRMGVEVVYTSQVDQWGEMGNVCVYRETGKQCSFCRCDGKNMKIATQLPND